MDTLLTANGLWEQATGAISSLLGVVVVFGTLVFIHELGHFLVAKAAGVRVFDFALGFGPAILKKQWRGTAYAIRAFPLGGFVRMASRDEMPEGFEEGVPQEEQFDSKPLWQRLAIAAAGPAMNILLAFLLIVVYRMAITVPPTIYSVYPDSPAAVAGLEPGDQFVSVDGTPVQSLDDVVGNIRQKVGNPVSVAVKRGNQIVTVNVIPKADSQGGTGQIGVELFEQQRQPLFTAVSAAFTETGRWITTIIVSITDMITGRIRPEISGPVGIVVITGTAAQEGIASLLRLGIILNVNLALFNLFPIPLLDGFRMVLMVFESIRRKPLKPEHRGMVQFVGLALLMLLLVFATYQDLARFLPGA